MAKFTTAGWHARNLGNSNLSEMRWDRDGVFIIFYNQINYLLAHRLFSQTRSGALETLKL